MLPWEPPLKAKNPKIKIKEPRAANYNKTTRKSILVDKVVDKIMMYLHDTTAIRGGAEMGLLSVFDSAVSH